MHGLNNHCCRILKVSVFYKIFLYFEQFDKYKILGILLNTVKLTVCHCKLSNFAQKCLFFTLLNLHLGWIRIKWVIVKNKTFIRNITQSKPNVDEMKIKSDDSQLMFRVYSTHYYLNCLLIVLTIELSLKFLKKYSCHKWNN